VNVKKLVKPSGHFIGDRKAEILVGLVLFLAGSMLIWDAFDGRGKKMPWPGGAIMPF
jgi:hypothetical protein